MKRSALLAAGLVIVANLSAGAVAQDGGRGDQAARPQFDQGGDGRGQDLRGGPCDSGRGDQGGQGDRSGDQRGNGAATGATRVHAATSAMAAAMIAAIGAVRTIGLCGAGRSAVITAIAGS